MPRKKEIPYTKLFKKDGNAILLNTSIDAITITSSVMATEGSERSEDRLWSQARVGEIAHVLKNELFPHSQAKGFWNNPGSWTCESLMYKHSKSGAICSIKGQKTPLAWAIIMSYARDEYKATRIDLCQDIELKKPYRVLPALYNRLPEELKGKALLIQGKNSDDTLYIGSRESAVFGRIYDKSEYYDLPTTSVYRFEIEYKKAHPKTVFKEMSECEDMAEYISTAMYNQYKRTWNIPIPTEYRRPKEIRAQVLTLTTDEIKLQWLSRQVKKTVDTLRSNGREREALDALGLRDFVCGIDN